jgi:hypothetical protein
MDDSPNNLQPENSGGNTGNSIAFLILAFIPCLVGIGMLNYKIKGDWQFNFLFMLDVVCSLISGIGILGGIKDVGTKFAVAVLVVPFFFVINAFIYFFVGCSSIGRIAP